MSAPPAPALLLRGARVAAGDRVILDGLDLAVAAGERVAVVGPSGAGKTTLLELLGATRRAAPGEVAVLGVDPAPLGERGLRDLQRRIGRVHQQLDLVGPLRVVHNVNAGRLGSWSTARALASLVRPRDVGAVATALERVGMADRLHERTDRLSGGEQQRVALARVLVQRPELVLADEPIASLDPERARDVLTLLATLAGELGSTLVVSLHAFDLARSHLDRVIGLRAGRIHFDEPAERVTDELAASLYRIDDRGR